MSSLKQIISCTSDYDPDALPVARANEVIRSFVKPVSGVEKLPVRAALGRVLAKEVVSPINVPSHDNSAMDGYAVRNDDLGAGEPVTLTEIGTSAWCATLNPVEVGFDDELEAFQYQHPEDLHNWKDAPPA